MCIDLDGVYSKSLELNEEWDKSYVNFYLQIIQLIADTEFKLLRLVSKFGWVCDERNLLVNLEMIKVRIEVEFKDKVIEEMEGFRYLGATVVVGGGMGWSVSNWINE